MFKQNNTFKQPLAGEPYDFEGTYAGEPVLLELVKLLNSMQPALYKYFLSLENFSTHLKTS